MNITKIIQSFYYLFIPTWFFTVILYTLMAKKYGAAEKYPEEEAAEEVYNKEVAAFQEEQALTAPMPVKDHSLLSKVLHVVSRASLVITMVLACIVMWGSPDMAAYDMNREIFYKYGFICTLTCFVFAYWVMRRKKALVKAPVEVAMS